ncbi:ParB/RepB/Spo0J family partition protein [Vermiculatibacterium agrestimuris]|uniref:ParB/RepB/Spo0J family partition protein n=1 Tax=Vermiculatibacterium agrestimuris TaxID=2941519 RepID=UPI00203EDED7|nr:ParB/RepB/Spo0J family partition protein [Vermiculatibacterium agrestimuris]
MINEQPKKKSALLPVCQLHAFDGHPYKVLDNEEMAVLTESIKEQGILSPLIVRPLENGEYEVISGHRRLHAAEKVGLTEVPALIYPLDRNEAILAVVDSNLHREHILPSEKAFAYKLKMEALKQQGKRTLSQVATKTDTAAEIGKETGESRDQVFRYIRLTYLIPELLEMVDEEKIALTPTSYLSEKEQRDLLDTMQCEDCTPSLSQAQQLKKASQKGELSTDYIFAMLSEPKPNQREKITFKVDELRSFFPKHYTTEDIQKAIIGLILKQYQEQKRQRSRRRTDRGER